MLEKTLESPLDCKEIKSVHPKGNQPWIFIGRTDAEAEVPILDHMIQRADSLEKTLMLGKIEGRRKWNGRGWDGWMTSLTRWTWVWVGSRSWWWTGKPGVQQSMGSKRAGHDWATEMELTSPTWVPSNVHFPPSFLSSQHYYTCGSNLYGSVQTFWPKEWSGSVFLSWLGSGVGRQILP